jgi:hypothetical protein
LPSGRKRVLISTMTAVGRYMFRCTERLKKAVVVGCLQRWRAITFGAFFVGALFVLIQPVFAADGIPLWTNRFNGPTTGLDLAYSMAVNGSGDVFVTGEAGTRAYSAAGVPLWTNFTAAGSIALDESGRVLVTGKGGTMALSSAGVPIWTNSTAAYQLVVDAEGNVIVTASQGESVDFDFETIKYSPAGLPLWTNRYNGPVGGQDNAVAVAVDRSGNVFVTGISDANVHAIGVPPNSDYATVKYSSAGQLLWVNRFNGPADKNDKPIALATDADGNVFVTGYTSLSSNSRYATIAYSGSGVPLWTNYYQGPGSGPHRATAIAVDQSGSVYVTGQSYAFGASSDYGTIKYSGAGTALWTNSYNGPASSADVPFAMALDRNGNVFVTGYSSGDGSFADYATVAYSGAGVPLWTNRYNGPDNVGDEGHLLAVDHNGNVLVAGWSNDGDGIDFDYSVIKYAVEPPTPISFSQLSALDGQFQFQFNADSNRIYAAEFSDFFGPTNWQSLTNFAAYPVDTNLTVVDAITNSARLYRVRTQ